MMLLMMPMIFTAGKLFYMYHEYSTQITQYSFKSLMYDEEHVSFSDLPHNALTVLEYKSCYSCDSRVTEAQMEEDFQTDIGVTHHGVHYHLDEFVFVHPTDQSKLLDIGQITKFRGKLPNMEVHIRYLGRYDDYVMQQKRRLEGLELALDEVRCFYFLLLSTQESLLSFSADCFTISGHLPFQSVNLMAFVMSSISLMRIRLRLGLSMTITSF